MKTAKSTLVRMALLLGLLIPLNMSNPAYAAIAPEITGGSNPPSSSSSSTAANCSNTTGSNGKVSQEKVSKCLDQTPIVQDIQTIVNFLSAAVGVVVIAVIILGGVQYTLAGDNSSALQAARQRITNGLIALFAFMFAFAFLQWLIPGGILQ